MRPAVGLLLLSALFGCTGNATQKTWSNMSQPERTAALDTIASECHLARRTFQLDGEELHFKPDPSEKYESVDCALGRLKTIEGFSRMGFVGNEKYVDEKQ